MPEGFDARLAWALALVLATAGAAGLVADSGEAALVAAVGGVAAVLLALLPDAPPERPHAERDGAGRDGEPPAPAPVLDSALDAVLDAVVQPLLLVEDGRVAFANRAALAELGGHIRGEDVRVAIRHPAAAARLSADPAGRAPDDARPVELVGLGAADRRWEMLVADAGRARVVQLIDRTGAYAAERMRVDFVANASHELRTPLASVLGYVETLADEAGEDPALRARFLKIVGDEARRMQRLVEDLISLSRIEGEKHRLPDTPVDLGRLVAEVAAELADADPARGGDLSLAVAPGLPPVHGDRPRLSQMLHNVVGNALKYGRAGTPVSVTLARDGAMLRLAVEDRGEGVAPEHIPRLTERFYRVDTGRSRSLGGTGLGLAIVKHIVERHRGRLDIASRPGEGTRVTVLLPVPADAADAVTKP